MSHIVTIATEVRDAVAVAAAVPQTPRPQGIRIQAGLP